MAGSDKARAQVDQEVDEAASHFNLIDQPISEVAEEGQLIILTSMRFHHHDNPADEHN